MPSIHSASSRTTSRWLSRALGKPQIRSVLFFHFHSRHSYTMRTSRLSKEEALTFILTHIVVER
ncbi:MAG TPA: hypothetical protein QF517_00575, partial [Pseudomonadales bacterium]|nr:hypothetical protein [Pseudomonadales bacterium]